MRKRLKILRQKSMEEAPYFEEFVFETGDENATVATALTYIGRTSDLAWEHSCLQKKCGACAMVVDSVPCLACDTLLAKSKGETVTIEPLKKFPVVKDLVVDRKAITERLKELQIYLLRAEEKNSQKADETVYEASRCLQCGLCLEVCPNYYRDGAFSGMAAMAPMARVLAREEGTRAREIKKTYRRYVYEGCGRSLACRSICPAGLDIEMLLSRSNRAAFRR